MNESIGRYLLKHELGRGGMATVYLAHDPRVDRNVALKLLPREFLHDPMFRTRFEREAKTIAGLEHPAIVPLYDFGEEEGQPYLVMRYMPGGSLDQRLRTGPIGVEEAARIFTRLGPALDMAHVKGIIHRDLKPGNILLDEQGRPYLSDFGIVKISEATAALTGSGVIGTPAYMSPEQASGKGAVDGRSDIYALGTILFEMLTGQAPYRADTPVGVVVMHITEPVPSILDVKPDLPIQLEGVIQRVLAKQPGQRYQTATDLAKALAEVAEGRAPAMAPPIEPKKTLAVLPEEEAAPAEHAPTAVEPPPGVKQEETRLVDTDAAPPLQDLPELGEVRERKGVSVWGWILIGVVGIGIAVAGIGGTTGLFATSPAPTDTLEPTATLTNTIVPTDTPQPTETPLPTSTPVIFEPANVVQLAELIDSPGDMMDVEWSPDGTYITGVERIYNLSDGSWENGWIYVWSIDDLSVTTARFQTDMKFPQDLAWSPSGDHLASCGNNLIQIWNTNDWSQELTFELPITVGTLKTLEWFSDSGKFATHSSDGKIRIWDLTSGEVVNEICCQSFKMPSGNMALSPDELKIVSTGDITSIITMDNEGTDLDYYESGLRVWDVETGEKLFEHIKVSSRSAEWSPDSVNIIYAGYDRSNSRYATFIVDVIKGEEVQMWTEVVDILDLASSTNFLASGSGDTIDIYDYLSGELLRTIDDYDRQFEESIITNLAWSPDGKLLAAASTDGTIRVWGMPTE